MAVSVLVADDEKELAESFCLLLQALDYDVFMALDGEKTLALVKEKKPDVLILDMRMPKLTGEEVLRELSKLGVKIKVIISTGHSLEDETMKDRILKTFKVHAFLEKPTSIEEMDFVIKEILKEA